MVALIWSLFCPKVNVNRTVFRTVHLNRSLLKQLGRYVALNHNIYIAVGLTPAEWAQGVHSTLKICTLISSASIKPAVTYQ